MAQQSRKLHPLPVRIMHWTNAVAMFIMVGSGWKIYNDEVIFGLLHFPDYLTIGKWAQYALQWHFFGMWILALNGLAYLSYGFATGRFRRMLLPVTLARHSPDHQGNAALPSRPRRPDQIQRGAEAALYRRHLRRHRHRHFRPVHVEAGAVLRDAVAAVRQFPERAAGPLPLHGGDRRLSSWCTWRWRCWCRARWSTWSPAAPKSMPIPRASPRSPSRPSRSTPDDPPALALAVPPQKRRRPEHPQREQAPGRADRPPQRAARRSQPRRADHAHRLRRQRADPGAAGAARGLRLERQGAGGHFPPEPPRPDLSGIDGGEAAALQRLLRRRGRQAGRLRRPGNSSCRASSRTRSRGRCRTSTPSPSRK